MTAYAFGDTARARARLALVADTFAGPTRTLLGDLPGGGYRYVIDMGCGPGFTTGLFRDAIPHSFTTGIDSSAAMIAEARDRVPDAFFTVGDVTAKLSLPAHLVYARLLLGHLPDPAAALAHWVAPLRIGGLIVCEEPVRYRSDDPLFTRYEAAVTAVVAARGATLWAGPVLDLDPRQCERVLDRVVRASGGGHAGGGDVLAQRGHVGRRSGSRRRTARGRTLRSFGHRHVGIAPDGVEQGRRVGRRYDHP